ncbi:MAG TPA: hypothetical protein VNR60_08970 [Croceibacterium sp.]|nr:hypothetical protein [Croceibacterium sp.]
MASCSFQQTIFVKMFRRWAAARDGGFDRRLTMVDAYRGPGNAMMAAVAADSLFDLVEAHLGRQLTCACCCSPALAADEAALLGLLHYSAGAGGVMISSPIPHGLSGAICWAAKAVRRELGFPKPSRTPSPRPAARCPFRPQGEMRPQAPAESPAMTLRTLQ